jgi:hypothetical protein
MTRLTAAIIFSRVNSCYLDVLVLSFLIGRFYHTYHLSARTELCYLYNSLHYFHCQSKLKRPPNKLQVDLEVNGIKDPLEALELYRAKDLIEKA